jgi:carbonic anhydrase
MKNVSSILPCIVFFILSCQQQAPKEDTVAEAEDTVVAAPSKPESVRPVHWSYTEEGGPAGWASLTPVYSSCGNGKIQSPINLISGTSQGTSSWLIDYGTTKLHIAHNEHVDELINNGHTIQVTPQDGSSITYNGKVYHLKQFHFHTPSEHTLNGKHAPMEMHFVHQSDDKNLAVIGVFVREGKDNKTFDQLVKYLPNQPGEKMTHDSVNIDIALHIPKTLSAYHYVGSLTTPPCTEDVQWLVLKEHSTMSKEQIAAFSSRIKKNNRPTQPLNERKITNDELTSK